MARRKAKFTEPLELRRNNTAEDQPYLGGFAVVASGPHSGRYGVYSSTLTFDPETGMPKLIDILTRDDHNEYLAVDYADCRRSEAGGR